MNNISKKFVDIKQENRAAFIPFMVAGDPANKKSLVILRKLARYADVLEIGFPYTDPVADGPVIQAAHTRALHNLYTTDNAFNLIKNLKVKIPIVVMIYANLIEALGIENFYRKAAKAGISGVLIPDVPLEEIDPYLLAARRRNIEQILLITPNSSPQRQIAILKKSSSFVYVVSVMGVTGKRRNLPTGIHSFISNLKKRTNIPVAVGFGISTHKQFRQLKESGADGVIVGSALVEYIHKTGRPDNFLKTFLT